jgi:hypothetical protein
MNKYVQVQEVGMAFETKKVRFVALSGIDLSIKQGEFVSRALRLRQIDVVEPQRRFTATDIRFCILRRA